MSADLPRVVWLKRFLRAPCLQLPCDVPGSVLLLYRDTAGAILSRHFASKPFAEEYTSNFSGNGSPPTTEEVIEEFAASPVLSLAAQTLLQELTMTTKAKTTKPSTKPVAKGNMKPLSKAEQAKYEKSKQDAAAANAAAKPAAVPTRDAATKPDPKAPAPAKAKAEKAPAKAKEPKKKKFDGTTKFVAIVKEDDEGVRMQDTSRRTKVFRVIAKAGKKGIPVADLAKECKLTETEVLSDIGKLLWPGKERIAKLD